ncbi:DUF6924 domain-containing protein [Kutzneria sp. CA-103260]|uniref:DUF6924 domain-containing protein n=1 Tax=Kutzneria sp. CA-103260 TaxID=2802641 RepID=UPI001BA738ED|nr:hypothetical protein [Kutzneria sp. CA-103260]QUQ63540.1 hypothetical protein JJ691_12530 [Kutzneria sp. CA-103260]
MESLAKAAAERDETDKLVVRTHFGDDRAWQAVLAAGLESWGDEDDQDDEGFESTTYAVDDPALAGWSVEQVREAVAEQDPNLPVLFVADEQTMLASHHALLAVNMDDEPNFMDNGEYGTEHLTEFGRQFRIVPRHASGVHVNLWLANMDFTDWAQTAGASPDGVFHDFD